MNAGFPPSPPGRVRAVDQSALLALRGGGAIGGQYVEERFRGSRLFFPALVLLTGACRSERGFDPCKTQRFDKEAHHITLTGQSPSIPQKHWNKEVKLLKGLWGLSCGSVSVGSSPVKSVWFIYFPKFCFISPKFSIFLFNFSGLWFNG